MSTKSSLQEIYIKDLIAKKVLVSVYLKNGIRLTGVFAENDTDVVFLKNMETQMIYKSAISTVVTQG